MTDLNGAQPQPQPMQPVYFGRQHASMARTGLIIPGATS